MNDIVDYVAALLGVDPVLLPLILGVIVALANLAGKLIPDSATGPLGILRKVCKVVGLYITNRVTPSVSTGDVTRALAATLPDDVIVDASQQLSSAVKAGTNFGAVAATLAEVAGARTVTRSSRVTSPFAATKAKTQSPAFVGFIAIILSLLFLTGCAAVSALSSLPASPAAVCDRTLLDEQAGTGVELGYKAWRVGMELAVDSGKLHGAAATKIAKIDNQLYAGTVAVQTAYSTCNAASYRQAISKAQATLVAATNALKGN